jgi:hypothetical protein
MTAYACLQHRRLAAWARKKEMAAHRLNPVCPPHAAPSSISSFDRHRNNVRTAENASANNGSVNNLPK